MATVSMASARTLAAASSPHLGVESIAFLNERTKGAVDPFGPSRRLLVGVDSEASVSEQGGVVRHGVHPEDGHSFVVDERGYELEGILLSTAHMAKGAKMPSQVILEFEGVTTKEYDAVNDALGIDMETGKGDWPEGLRVHAAGLNESGHLVVTEVWDTPEHQAKFMEERLGEALAQGGITGPPSSITWIELVSHHTPGA